MEPPFVDTVFWGRNEQRCDEITSNDLQDHVNKIENRVAEAHNIQLLTVVFTVFGGLLALMVAWQVGTTCFALASFAVLGVGYWYVLPLLRRQASRRIDWSLKRHERDQQLRELQL